MAIAWGPKGTSGNYLVEVDGAIVKGFAGFTAAKDARKHAHRIANARGGKAVTRTVFPGDPKPAPAKAKQPLPKHPPQPPAVPGTLKSLMASLAAGDLDGELDAVFAGETGRDKPRKRALAAIEARRAALKE